MIRNFASPVAIETSLGEATRLKRDTKSGGPVWLGDRWSESWWRYSYGPRRRGACYQRPVIRAGCQHQRVHGEDTTLGS
jgi:hypothetical protein